MDLRQKERDEHNIERKDDHPEKNTARIQREGGSESGVTRKRVIRQREDSEGVQRVTEEEKRNQRQDGTRGAKDIREFVNKSCRRQC